MNIIKVQHDNDDDHIDKQNKDHHNNDSDHNDNIYIYI